MYVNTTIIMQPEILMAKLTPFPTIFSKMHIDPPKIKLKLGIMYFKKSIIDITVSRIIKVK